MYHSSLLRGERWPKESTFLEEKEIFIIPACDPTKQSHLSHHDEVSIFLQPEIAIADEEHIFQWGLNVDHLLISAYDYMR